jgi:hypothetical protein
MSEQLGYHVTKRVRDLCHELFVRIVTTMRIREWECGCAINAYKI